MIVSFIFYDLDDNTSLELTFIYVKQVTIGPKDAKKRGDMKIDKETVQRGLSGAEEAQGDGSAIRVSHMLDKCV